MVSPGGLLPPLPGGQAGNFGSARPVFLGGKTLSRVYDNIKAFGNGSYWSERAYTSEGSWRSDMAVPKGANWNEGTLAGEWQPGGSWGWGGPAAPQAIPGYSATKWGFTAGWIQRGGGYQIWVPDARNAIPVGAVKTQPTPWTEP